MLRIPFLPTAYPDELFASLLTRTKLHNSTGLWRCLLEEAGYGPISVSPHFTPPMQDARLDRLLAVLGYPYPRMLRELTVLPFWLAFNRTTNGHFRINLESSNGHVTNLSRLGYAQFLPGARYCPACLCDDMKEYGEPYLHRQHQLPVASICTRHGVVLQLACPACGICVLPFTKSLLRPPALRCQCGNDLTRSTAPSPEHLPALLRLSRFAADTLACAEAPWTSEQVWAVLHERSKIPRERFRRGALQLLQDIYGAPENSQFRNSSVLTWKGAGTPLRLRIGSSVGMLRAPEFSALLSATGLSFDEFKQAVSQIEVKAPPAKRTRRPFTIEQARREFLRFEADSPGNAATRLLQSSPKLFWLLRLRDLAFMKTYGSLVRQPVQTIMADRERIEELFRQHGGKIPHNNASRIRASIRDGSWLHSRFQANTATTGSLLTKAQRTQQERAVALSRAVLSALRTQSRPARVNAGVLAKFVQISMQQAHKTIAGTPKLKAMIAAVNAGKDRRLAFWAARELIKEGRYPTSEKVLVRAGLNSTRVNRQFCTQAIACFTATQ